MTGIASDGVEELTAALSNGLSHYVLYSAQHPVVLQSCRQVVEAVGSLCTDDALFLRVAGGHLRVDGEVLVGPTIRGRRLIELMRSLSSGGLLLRRGLTDAELLRLFALAEGMDGPPRPLAAAREELERHGVAHVGLASTDEETAWYGPFRPPQRAFAAQRAREERAVESVALRPSFPLYQTMHDTVEESLSRAASGDAPDVNVARTVGEQLQHATRSGFGDMLQLAHYPDYDAYTVGHSIRVALYAMCVGSRLGLPPEMLTELAAAGLLHDVGKARVPHAVLYKPDRLDEEERRVMARHPYDGAEILMATPDASRFAVGAAWGHHLRHDRRGYPRTREWARSTRVTALMQVCDVFEALTARRPYKPPYSPRRAYEIMLRDRGAFDPAALSTFVRAIGLYPPGSYVLLSDGRAARVTHAGTAIDRPCVRLVAEETLLDLSSPDGAGIGVLDALSAAEAKAAAAQGAPSQGAPSPEAEEPAEGREGDGDDDLGLTETPCR